MIRHAAAVAFVLCLSPSWLSAQSTELTVNVASASIHKGPSTGSPVIGKAPRGAVLEVTRELGSWVRVSWPDAEDGAGYVHVSMLSGPGDSTRNRRAGFAPAAGETRSGTAPGVSAAYTNAGGQATPIPADYIAPPTHIVGLGARMGFSEFGFGASARVWSRKQVGVQFDLSRSTLTSPTLAERMTSTDFAPSVVYSFKDRMSEDVWVRPYIGGGANIYRSSLRLTPDAPDSISDTSMGFQTFGGGEVTFPSVPRFAMSADLGYRWAETPFPGFEVGGLTFSLSGHWYVK